MSNYIRNAWRLNWEGPSAFAREILCYPAEWAARIKPFLIGDKDSKSVTLNYTVALGDYCDAEGRCDYPLGVEGSEDPEGSEKPPAEFEQFETIIPRHFSVSDLLKVSPNNAILNGIVVYKDLGLCWAPTTTMIRYKDVVARILHFMYLPLEHLVDKSILKRFFAESGLGRLASGVTSKYGPIPIDFWTHLWDIDLDLEPSVPALPGRRAYKLPFVISRAFECLGSIRNTQVLTPVDSEINDAKNCVLRFQRRMQPDTVRHYLRTKGKTANLIKKHKETFVARLRATFAMFHYMNQPDVQVKLNKIVEDVNRQFKFAEAVYNRDSPVKVRLADYWLEWIQDRISGPTRSV
ncbi:hypothetical protein FGRMN_300 [Fusarium graminum]|nr:hypothetical protein FGRMN_300 [Fusarium graminum]